MIEYVYPEIPNHPYQAYRVTDTVRNGSRVQTSEEQIAILNAHFLINNNLF